MNVKMRTLLLHTLAACIATLQHPADAFSIQTFLHVAPTALIWNVRLLATSHGSPADCSTRSSGLPICPAASSPAQHMAGHAYSKGHHGSYLYSDVNLSNAEAYAQARNQGSTLLWLLIGAFGCGLSIVVLCERFWLCLDRFVIVVFPEMTCSDTFWDDVQRSLGLLMPTFLEWQHSMNITLQDVVYATMHIAKVLYCLNTGFPIRAASNSTLLGKFVHYMFVLACWWYASTPSRAMPIARVTFAVVLLAKLLLPYGFEQIAVAGLAILIYITPFSHTTWATISRSFATVVFIVLCSLIAAMVLVVAAVQLTWKLIQVAWMVLCCILCFVFEAVVLCWNVVCGLWGCTGNVFVLVGAAETAALAALAQSMRKLQAQMSSKHKYARRIWRRTNGDARLFLSQLLYGIDSCTSSASSKSSGKHAGKAGKRARAIASASSSASGNSNAAQQQQPSKYRAAQNSGMSTSVSDASSCSSDDDDDGSMQDLLVLASSFPSLKSSNPSQAKALKSVKQTTLNAGSSRAERSTACGKQTTTGVSQATNKSSLATQLPAICSPKPAVVIAMPRSGGGSQDTGSAQVAARSGGSTASASRKKNVPQLEPALARTSADACTRSLSHRPTPAAAGQEGRQNAVASPGINSSSARPQQNESVERPTSAISRLPNPVVPATAVHLPDATLPGFASSAASTSFPAIVGPAEAANYVACCDAPAAPAWGGAPGPASTLLSATSTPLFSAAVQQPYRPLQFSNSGQSIALPPIADALRSTAVTECTPGETANKVARSDGQAAGDDVDDDMLALCVICWEASRTHALVHGNDAHLCLCERCCDEWDYKSKGCPMCRREVECSLKVH